ncbi:hypothetical protein GY45DRAFT_483546 [Cubamyces sp. BRFM 1775]|nr:hypothetical protein GY45DRAFT_483546 [Cubamyces sp. BRFM 1775]
MRPLRRWLGLKPWAPRPRRLHVAVEVDLLPSDPRSAAMTRAAVAFLSIAKLKRLMPARQNDRRRRSTSRTRPRVRNGRSRTRSPAGLQVIRQPQWFR